MEDGYLYVIIYFRFPYVKKRYFLPTFTLLSLCPIYPGRGDFVFPRSLKGVASVHNRLFRWSVLRRLFISKQPEKPGGWFPETQPAGECSFRFYGFFFAWWRQKQFPPGEICIYLTISLKNRHIFCYNVVWKWFCQTWWRALTMDKENGLIALLCIRIPPCLWAGGHNHKYAEMVALPMRRYNLRRRFFTYLGAMTGHRRLYVNKTGILFYSRSGGWNEQWTHWGKQTAPGQ